MGVNGAGTRVGTVGELATGEAAIVEADGRSVALFNIDGTYYAIDNACPHRGGPLGEGDIEGHVVSCPWHAWRWDVSTGGNVNNPAVRVACFPVRLEGDGIFVDLAAHASPGGGQGV